MRGEAGRGGRRRVEEGANASHLCQRSKKERGKRKDEQIRCGEEITCGEKESRAVEIREK